MTNQVLDSKMDYFEQPQYDIRDFIPSKGSVPYQLCTYLENQLDEKHYQMLLDQWLGMSSSVAQWCYEQVLTPFEDKPLSIDQMALNLLKAINTAHEIISRHES